MNLQIAIVACRGSLVMRETKDSTRGIQVEQSANWGALAGT